MGKSGSQCDQIWPFLKYFGNFFFGQNNLIKKLPTFWCYFEQDQFLVKTALATFRATFGKLGLSLFQQLVVDSSIIFRYCR